MSERTYTFADNKLYAGSYVMSCLSGIVENYNWQKDKIIKLEIELEQYKWIIKRLRIGDYEGARDELLRQESQK